MENVAVEPKREANGKKKVFWIVGCLVIAILACVAIAVGIFIWINNNAPEKNPNLAQKDGDTFIFYYPNYYESDSYGIDSFAYSATDENSLTGHNTIQVFSNDDDYTYDDSEIISNEDCRSAGQATIDETLSLYPDSGLEMNLTSTKYSDFNGISKCYFKVVTTIDDKQGIVETRVLNKAEPISVVIVYASDTDVLEIEDLQDALNAFKLK